MTKRVGALWTLVIAVALTASVASAQGQGGGQGGPRMGGMRGGPEIMGRILCDVEGLWFAATFDAKLDAAALDKLKPVCQKAYDARAKEFGAVDMGDPVQHAMAVKGVGDEMEKAAKDALGANTAKLENWFKKRDDTMKELEARFANGGAAGRGPQPTPVPANPGAAPAPAAPATPAPVGDTKKEEKK